MNSQYFSINVEGPLQRYFPTMIVLNINTTDLVFIIALANAIPRVKFYTNYK